MYIQGRVAYRGRLGIRRNLRSNHGSATYQVWTLGTPWTTLCLSSHVWERIWRYLPHGLIGKSKWESWCHFHSQSLAPHPSSHPRGLLSLTHFGSSIGISCWSPLCIQCFSHKMATMFSSAFWSVKDVITDLSDVVGRSCFPVFGLQCLVNSCLTSVSTQNSMWDPPWQQNKRTDSWNRSSSCGLMRIRGRRTRTAAATP